MKKAIEYLEEQKNYNSIKSQYNKKWYNRFEFLIISLTITTTVILTFKDVPLYVPAITSGLAALLKTLSSTFGFQKLWIECRIMTEKLKSEKRKYEARILEYKGLSDIEVEEQLAIRLESIISNGNEIWQVFIKDNKEKEK